MALIAKKNTIGTEFETRSTPAQSPVLHWIKRPVDDNERRDIAELEAAKARLKRNRESHVAYARKFTKKHTGKEVF
jgi:hypothetical protein